MKTFILSLLFLVLAAFPVTAASNQANSNSITYQAVITKILEEKNINFEQKSQLYQKLELEIKQRTEDNIVIIENGILPEAKTTKYKVGDKVIVSELETQSGTTFYISDFVRTPSLRNLFLLFIFIAILIARWKGVRALIGMGLSVVIIYYGFIASMYHGNNPIIATLLGSILIIPINYYLSHGINRKTTVAILGTVITMCLAVLLTVISINSVKLTGLESEDASFVSLLIPGISINMQGILLAGIIIGLLGILDDITISQSGIVEELHHTNPKLSAKELYRKSMNIGKDHIASVINTLLLVYTGASLPLLLLFYNNSQPFYEIMNYEIVADEIVRTLVGSISLMVAVPITTLLASLAVIYVKPKK